MTCIKKFNKFFVLSILLFSVFIVTYSSSFAMNVDSFNYALIPNGVYLCDESYNDPENVAAAYNNNKLRHITNSIHNIFWTTLDFDDRIDYIVIKGPYRVRIYEHPNFIKLINWSQVYYSSLGASIFSGSSNSSPFIYSSNPDINFIAFSNSNLLDPSDGYMVGSSNGNPIAYQLSNPNVASSIFVDSSFVGSNQIIDGSITSADIADRSITGVHIQQETVSSFNLSPLVKDILSNAVSFSYKVLTNQKFEIQLPNLTSDYLNNASTDSIKAWYCNTTYNQTFTNSNKVKTLYNNDYREKMFFDAYNGSNGLNTNSDTTSSTSTSANNFVYLTKDASGAYKLNGIFNSSGVKNLTFYKNDKISNGIISPAANIDDLPTIPSLKITLNVVDAPTATTPTITFN